MFIKSIELKNFRNIAHLCLQPTEGMHLIYGENAQGKTNIMEAIWLFSGCKSFRGAKDMDLVRFGEKKAELALSFAAADHQHTDGDDRDQIDDIEQGFCDCLHHASSSLVV